VPLVGDAFSFWFKSNARNHELIRKHAAAGHAPRRSNRGDWIFVIGVLVALSLIVCAGLFVTLYVVTKVLQYYRLRLVSAEVTLVRCVDRLACSAILFPKRGKISRAKSPRESPLLRFIGGQ
jgi:hypothetical protein